MSDLTIFPADLAAMSAAQLVALPITDFVAAERNVDEATAYLKQLRAKLDAAKLQRYGEQARNRDARPSSSQQASSRTWPPPWWTQPLQARCTAHARASSVTA